MPTGDHTSKKRRRERPTQPALTRQGIIDVALAILREQGLHKVTMRRIAAALDTGAASLYVYVRDTEDLHAQLLDALLGPVAAPAPSSGTWRERLIALLISYGRVLFDHPEIARMAMSTQPSGPNYLALVDAILALLHAGGASDQAAGWGVDTLLLYTTAVAVERSNRRASAARADQFTALTAEIAAADPTRYPQITRLSQELLAGPGPARSAWALNLILDGILANPHTPSERKPL